MTDRRTVLITRPEPDAGELAEALEYLGCDCIRAPLLTIRFLDDEKPDLTGVTALAFTSANGVRALIHAVPDAPGRGIGVFAVGDATARCAREAGFTRVTSAGGDVTALAETIAAALRDPLKEQDGTVLHVAGRERAGDLVRLLEERGVAARRAVLYAAEAAEELPWAAHEALARGDVDDVVIFSPRTARQFVTLMEKAELSRAASHMRLVALSDNVARAAAGLGFAEVSVASRPDQAALLNLFALQNVQAAMSDSDKSTDDKGTGREKDAGRKKGDSEKKPDAPRPDPKTSGETTPEAATDSESTGMSDTAIPGSPFADRRDSASTEDVETPAPAAPRRKFPVGLAILAVVVILVAAGGWAATRPDVRQWVASRLAPEAAENTGNATAQAALGGRLDALERQVRELSDRVAQNAAQAADRNVADTRVPALAARVDEIADKVTALESRVPEGVPAPDSLAPLREQLSTLAGKLDVLSARTDRLSGPSSEAIDNRIAVLGFVSALDTGRPFAPFAAAARARVADMDSASQVAFDTVMPAAARGVPTPAMLAARAVALTLVRAPEAPTPEARGAETGGTRTEEGGLWDRVTERLSGLVTIRRVDETGAAPAPPRPVPDLAPVHAALAVGDLETAAVALDAIDSAPLSEGSRTALDALKRDLTLRRAGDDLARALDAAVASSAPAASPSP